MHQSLEISNLNRLPFSSRRVATAVCAPHASQDDIDRFADLEETFSGPKLIAFLPVYYVLLDPERIPSSDQLDAPSPAMIRTIDAALIAIESVFVVAPSPDSAPESTVDLDPICPNIPRSSCSEEALGIGCLTLAEDIGAQESHPNQQRILSSPGFQTLMVRTWAGILGRPKDTTHQAVAVYQVFKFMKLGLPHFVEDMIDGAGGSVDLADMVMRHLAVADLDADIRLSHLQLALLEAILPFLVDVTGKFSTEGEETRPLCCALVERGLVEELTTVASFMTRRIYRLVPDAVRGGLLGAIVTCAERDFPGSVNDRLSFLLDKVLGPATTSCEVLADIGTAYFAVSTDRLIHSKIGGSWSQFAATVKLRLSVLRSFDSQEILSFRVCDNIACGIIRDKASMKCCSACCNVSYCSPKCQSLDWRDGGHRNVCASYQLVHKSFRVTSTSRERAFLRALLDNDYARARPGIYRLYATRWAEDPEARILTVLDYRFAQVKIQVQTVRPDTLPQPGEQNAPTAHMDEMIRRAGQSGGRIAVDVMLLRDGSHALHRTLPRRGCTPEVHDALRKIATRLRETPSEDATEYEREIKALVRLSNFIC
ncbi:hypothetical protein C8R43DRAFT_1102288 [Mycena crocata]|nr:hypothetical protein C8R43DRAFT_1102288 [Mycena crocata]